MNVDRITFNSETENFEALISNGHKTYSISLYDFKESETNKASALVSDICSWLPSTYEIIRDFCASKLLSLKNETWLEEDEEPLTKERFAEIITLKSIAAYSDGSLTLYFDDNDIFWGHSIVVYVRKNHVLYDANIAG